MIGDYFPSPYFFTFTGLFWLQDPTPQRARLRPSHE